MERCGWCAGEGLYEAYHDQEWGVPRHDDKILFEFLVLEGAQAGLSWITVLKKRNHYREVMDGFDPILVVNWEMEKLDALMKDAGIIRNRLKLASVLQNARVFLRVQEEFGSFDEYLWRFVDGVPIQNNVKALNEIPTQTPVAAGLSKDLKKRGFNFVGPTICYAFMQAVGMVNDHVESCFRYKELGGGA